MTDFVAKGMEQAIWGLIGQMMVNRLRVMVGLNSESAGVSVLGVTGVERRCRYVYGEEKKEEAVLRDRNDLPRTLLAFCTVLGHVCVSEHPWLTSLHVLTPVKPQDLGVGKQMSYDISTFKCYVHIRLTRYLDV